MLKKTSAVIGLCLMNCLLVHAEEKSGPKLVKFQLVGLFCPEREQDLRDLFAKLEKFKLVKIDVANAEASVEFDSTKVWAGVKSEKYIELFDNELRHASRGSFGAKPLRTTSMDKLKWIEIPVDGLDCLGCSYAAYRLVYQLPGVEMATASFRTRTVRALIDPEKIDRDKLQSALKKGGVDVPPLPK
jgi:copper chaperone CopZ